jgi:hypothetical protein
MIRFFLFFLVSLICLIAGCRSQRVATVPVETRTTVIERLVEVQTPADSSWLHAWFECDSNSRVLLKSFEEDKTERMQTGLQLSDDQLSYRVIRIKDKIFIPARDSIIIQQVPVPVEIPVEVNRLTGWQYFQIWAGRIVLAALFLFLIYKIISKKL